MFSKMIYRECQPRVDSYHNVRRAKNVDNALSGKKKKSSRRDWEESDSSNKFWSNCFPTCFCSSRYEIRKSVLESVSDFYLARCLVFQLPFFPDPNTYVLHQEFLCAFPPPLSLFLSQISSTNLSCVK